MAETPAFSPSEGSENFPTIRYKPGWTFDWGGTDIQDLASDDRQVESQWLDIHVKQPDSKGFDRETMEERSVTFSFLVPLPFDPEWLRNRIAGVEEHEIGEWLRIDGKLAFDPHV